MSQRDGRPPIGEPYPSPAEIEVDRLRRELAEARRHDPDWKLRDGACDAYWRGQRDGVRGAVRLLREALESGRAPQVVGEELSELGAHLVRLRAVAEAARAAVDRTRDPECAWCGCEGPHDWSCPHRALVDRLDALDDGGSDVRGV